MNGLGSSDGFDRKRFWRSADRVDEEGFVSEWKILERNLCILPGLLGFSVVGCIVGGGVLG